MGERVIMTYLSLSLSLSLLVTTCTMAITSIQWTPPVTALQEDSTTTRDL